MRAITPSEIAPELLVDDQDLDLRAYLFILSNYKWGILGLTLIITLLSTLYVYSLDPIYRATSSILIDNDKENVVSIQEVYGMPNAYYEYYQTQLEILKSRQLAERVVKRLNLLNRTDFNESKKGKIPFLLDWKAWIPADWLPDKNTKKASLLLDGTARLKTLANQIMGMLEVEFVKDSQLVDIHYDTNNPYLAAQLANTLAEVYIESGLDSRLETTRKATSWITDQLQELKENLDKSEREIQTFRDKEKLIDAKGVDSIAVSGLEAVSSKLSDARRKRVETQELYRQVKALDGQPIEAYESIPAVLNNSLVNHAKTTLAASEQKVSELAKRYGPKHPVMIAATSELASARNNLKAQIKNVIASVKKEFVVAQAEESHLVNDLKLSKQEIAEINRKGNTLKTLEQEVESNRQLYNMFLTRFKETTATDDLKSTNARIIDTATAPSVPYKPNKPKFIFLAFSIGLVLSIFLVFLIETLNNTLKDSNDIENKLYLPALCILPKLNIWFQNDLKTMRYFSDKKHSSFSENIRTLRTGILLSDVDESHKTVLVTSSIPEEGKSIVAINLALAMGQMSKVLLIDADMRKPSIAKVFGLKRNEAGLTHFIAGTHELQQCVHHFSKDKIYVMPAGQIPSNPLELLSSNRFRKGLEALSESFDHIVIDTAPAVPVSDPIVLSRLVTSTIYVVKADETPYQLAKTGIKKLQQVDANVVGVVLNQVNPKKRPGRYGYAESDYYTYYGYSKS